ncbi:MAG TPA: hypothetical protein DET40_07515 [Lentisphaeria bacterium]|nr:MAG: hypothetical protein A2X45_06780 [Lentisphaerae bacterium GWF2_50_93]HCE43380.1 hypothetical protein [Lentisphaeria bacterium]
MGMLNRIVNITVLVLAIVSVVFGCLLFLKREELRFRGDKMASFIVNSVKILDVNSAADGSKNISDAKYEPNEKKNPNLVADEKKSLYHYNYKNLESVLAPVRLQTENIMKQRDFLGTALSKVGQKLELPEQFPATGFQGLPSYNQSEAKIIALVEKVNKRDNAIIDQIAASATVMGFTVDKETLKNLDNYTTPLSDFATKVEKLKKRADSYGEHIARICKIFQIAEPSLGGDDYGSELTNVASAMQKVKDEFEDTKAQLKLTREKLAKTEDELNQANAKIEALNKDMDKLKKDVAHWVKEYKKAMGIEEDGDIKEVPQAAEELVKMLEGKIIEVNDKWEFVVIDLGKNSKVYRPEGKKMKEIPVALPEGKVLMVGRNNGYIAKIKITKVNDNCAIGDIIPDLRNGEVSVGDKVFFAPEPKQEQAPAPVKIKGGAEAPAAN